MSSKEELLDDFELVKQFQCGQKTVFNEIIRRYKARIYNFIYRQIGNYSETEDLAQETFHRAYQALPKYQVQPHTKFSTWLFTIAVNLCRNYFRLHIFFPPILYTRKYSNQKEEPNSTNYMPDNLTISPERSIEDQERAEQIQQALSKLPEMQRMAILLRIVENKSYLEIATILGCSVSAVKSLIFRARINLARKIQTIL